MSVLLWATVAAVNLNGGVVEAQGIVQPVPLGPVGQRHNFLGSTDDPLAKRHRGPTGKPCISTVGDARSEIINPQIYQHIVIATNTCGKIIRLHVCYYKSEHCISVHVPAYSTREAVLGIMPAMRIFRFQYEEQFDPFNPNDQ
jgi:hypothetical protein